MRRAALARLAGIERALYAEIAGIGRAGTHADEDLPRSTDERTAAVHFLRFACPPDAITALRAGAGLAFGIDDARMPLRVDAAPALRAALLHDFD